MSTRSGSFVTLRELRDDIGRDACRYFYVMRKADQHLDFDLSLATSHRRITRYIMCSTLTPEYVEYLKALMTHHLIKIGHKSFGRFNNPRRARFSGHYWSVPEVIKRAADGLEAHLVCYYLQDLAADFHRWYNGSRLLVETLETRDARLALAKACTDCHSEWTFFAWCQCSEIDVMRDYHASITTSTN